MLAQRYRVGCQNRNFFAATIVFLTAPLAQLVEQRTLNPRVGGSSPPGCTTEFPLSSPERVSSVCFLRSSAAIQPIASVFSCNVRLSAETPAFVGKENAHGSVRSQRTESAGFRRQEMHAEACVPWHTKVCVPSRCILKGALPDTLKRALPVIRDTLQGASCWKRRLSSAYYWKRRLESAKNRRRH